jgi:hypothetical protein
MDKLIFGQESPASASPGQPEMNRSMPDLTRIDLEHGGSVGNDSTFSHRSIPSNIPPIMGMKIQLPTVSFEKGDSVSTEPPTSKEYRRICSEVISGQMYVSGWLVAEDWSQLESHGITHVINTACMVSKCPFPSAIAYLCLSIEDSRNEDILAYVYPCIGFIEAALLSGGRVLIHCMEGVSRSCTIAIAYVMWKQGLTYREAQDFVQSGRPVCQPNPGFICQLLDFEKRLRLTETRARIQRVTLRKVNDQLVLLAVSSSSVSDKRFPYLEYNPMNREMRLFVDHESPYRDLLIQLGQDAIDEIVCIERLDACIEICDFDPALLPIPCLAFDEDYAVCYEFFQLNGDVRTAPQEDEEPCTARSHRSHGSIDSARDRNRVRVYEYTDSVHALTDPIPFFDADDLDSRFHYLFVLSNLAIVWIGNETVEYDSGPMISHIRSLLPRPLVEIRVIQQGAEPDEFWDLFNPRSNSGT